MNSDYIDCPSAISVLYARVSLYQQKVNTSMETPAKNPPTSSMKRAAETPEEDVLKVRQPLPKKLKFDEVIEPAPGI